MRMPGFTGDLSLLPAVGPYHTVSVASPWSQSVVPQLPPVEKYLQSMWDAFWSPYGLSGWGGTGGRGWGADGGGSGNPLIDCLKNCDFKRLVRLMDCQDEDEHERRRCENLAKLNYAGCVTRCQP